MTTWYSNTTYNYCPKISIGDIVMRYSKQYIVASIDVSSYSDGTCTLNLVSKDKTIHLSLLYSKTSHTYGFWRSR